MHTHSLYIQDSQIPLKVVNTARMCNQAELCACMVNIVRVVQPGWHPHIKYCADNSRVQLSFDWLTPAVNCSNFGGNVKMHAKTVAVGECVPRTSGLRDQSLLAL